MSAFELDSSSFFVLTVNRRLSIHTSTCQSECQVEVLKYVLFQAIIHNNFDPVVLIICSVMMRVHSASFSLIFFFASNTAVSGSLKFFAHEPFRVGPNSPGWLASSRTGDNHGGRSIQSDSDIASRLMILKARGGASESSISADPEGVTLQGVVPPAESLYLPGLLDAAIHRTNKV